MCYYINVALDTGFLEMTSKLFNILLATTLSLIMTLLHNPDAYAHKVNMFAYSEGTDIFIEGYFSDGHKARNSTVTVYDPDGTELLQGMTDDNGQFSFPIPQKTDLRVVLNAGLGHQTEYVIKASEISDDVVMSSSNETGETGTGTSEMAINSADEESPALGDTVSNRELSLMIERAVGQAIKPLMRSVSEMREERSLGTIVGGIGYIVGILGVVFYVKARKERSQLNIQG